MSNATRLRDVHVAGLPLRVSNPLDARDEIVALGKSWLLHGAAVHLVNAYTIALAYQDPDYAHTLQSAQINFPDGKPLTWVSRLFGPPLHQVRGPQLFEDVMDAGRQVSLRHFLLGGTPDSLERLTSALIERYPGVQIVGAFSPPFRPMTRAEQADQDALIAASGAEVVWVGTGTPKQDFEVDRIAQSLPVVACAVGAAFDFSAGTKKGAPPWMIALGLEWLYRLGSEPRRLWRRYTVGNAIFLVAVVRGGRPRSGLRRTRR